MAICGRRAIDSTLFLLLCICVFSIVVASSHEKTLQKEHDDHEERNSCKDDAETNEAIKAFQASGLNIVQLMNNIKTLRSRSVYLTQEILTLKERLREEKAKAKGYDTIYEGSLPSAQKKRSWKALFCGESSEPDEKVIIVEGCQDTVCCSHMIWHMLSEGFYQFLQSVQSAVLDGLGWITGIIGGLWSTALGLFVVLCIYNCIAWIVLDFDMVQQRMTFAVHAFSSLPGVRLWKSALGTLTATKERINAEARGGHELADMKDQIEKLMKELEATKTERVDRDLGEECRETITENLYKSDKSEAEDAEKETTEAEDAEEKTVDEGDVDISALSNSWTCPGSPPAVDEMVS